MKHNEGERTASLPVTEGGGTCSPEGGGPQIHPMKGSAEAASMAGLLLTRGDPQQRAWVSVGGAEL